MSYTYGGKDRYTYRGDYATAKQEYDYFRRCLPQLIDTNSMVGDLSNRWVIFQNGWLGDFSSFPSAAEAIMWALQLYRGDAATWIVVRVSLEDHSISALHLLADSLSDAEFSG